MPNKYILLFLIGIFTQQLSGQCEIKLKECMSIVDDCEILIDNYKKLVDLKDTEINNLAKQSENYSDMYKSCQISLDVERAEYTHVIKTEKRKRKFWQIIGYVAIGTTIGSITYGILK
jgi:hypothetical protein